MKQSPARTAAAASLLLAAALTTACREIPPEAEGTNVFPFYRYASYKGSEDYELDILWPLFHVSQVHDRSTFRLFLFHTESMPDVYHDTWYLFPLVRSTKTAWRDELLVTPLFAYKQQGDTTTYDAIPFILDRVASVKTESGSWTGLRLLFEEADWGAKGTSVKLLDLLGLAHLFELDTSKKVFTETPEGVRPGIDVSFVKVLELVRLFGWTTQGAYRDVRVLEVMGSETFSLFRSQRRIDGSAHDGEGETHLFPVYFAGHDADSSYTHFWPLFGMKYEGENYHKYYFLYPVFAIEGDPVTDRSGFELLWPLIDYERAQDAKTLELLFIPIRWGNRPSAAPAPEPTAPQPSQPPSPAPRTSP